MSAVGRIQAELLSLGVGITFTLHVFALEGQTVPNVVTLTMANGAHSDAAASPLGRPRWGQQGKKQMIFGTWVCGCFQKIGVPKSSILIGFSIINHPFWGTPIFGNTHVDVCCDDWIG